MIVTACHVSYNLKVIEVVNVLLLCIIDWVMITSWELPLCNSYIQVFWHYVGSCVVLVIILYDRNQVF